MATKVQSDFAISPAMTLVEALEILKREERADSPAHRILLACGFTPLHVKTFLAAELTWRIPARRIEVSTGLFGDVAGSVAGVGPDQYDAVAVLIEWSDLDPRLGLRTLGGWKTRDLADIAACARRKLGMISSAVLAAAKHSVVTCSLPTLPLPPLFFTANAHASAAEMDIRKAVAECAAVLAQTPGIRLLRQQTVDQLSPLAERFDSKTEIDLGFPYRLPHAARLASLMSELIAARSPKKGLITDLDDTFWSGILGEAGVEGVAWDLERRAQIHGIYQQFLESLASAGVLVAVASKNDAELVTAALLREDLLCKQKSLFPVEAHWGPKSGSVRRILKAWNIAPDAVIFVDDSPMEAAEVKAAFPEMETVLFPSKDVRALWPLLEHLRDAFGKTAIHEEDELRLDSLRNAAVLTEAQIGAGGVGLDDFLRDADARVEFSFEDASDARSFELINKTNQFNLNGRRWDAAEWKRLLGAPGAMLISVSYRDKFGALGKIAVVAGMRDGRTAQIAAWVMSCRAFSRRIEHQTLKYLFKRFDLDEIVFDYTATPRNGPSTEFLAAITGAKPDGLVTLSKEQFETAAPPLFHTVDERQPA
jgi:FkbH-like protein